MNLRHSSDHPGYTEDSQVDLDSPGEIQTKTVVFRHFNQGLDEFGRSLDVGGSRTRSGLAVSGRNRGGSDKGGIALTVYVSPSRKLLVGDANCSLGYNELPIVRLRYIHS
ncbi:uncharacterized protein PHACADRAFT_262555 [Phanerochaete carnosa HHB-10118-sp]|uniref:Uncharacterized protein n=1 Tax=Phanerochaete carnosa (strain HHB-10118-sp) TaxID=650164 RepID=K5VZ16_PHACS|nr:uncharacterized protein PHACADRAFT_262555 [Phanerochaete carnosa HHB-10118-sp]EKM52090.1 hypothetical protein PHACADRAFT_262555 [Phanerochaete carnosa HHB-10118-sp]